LSGEDERTEVMVMATVQGPVRVLYTAEATADGGRDAHSKTSDGRLDGALDLPSELGGSGGPGTNPEQLFVAGYAVCFHNALAGAGPRCRPRARRSWRESVSERSARGASA
jgi:organic hydroperoxide reductase OsmC/OhrA